MRWRTKKYLVLEKRQRNKKWDHDAAVSRYKAEQPGVVFHTSAGAADNAWSVSIANSVHLSVPMQTYANKVYPLFDNYKEN